MPLIARIWRKSLDGLYYSREWLTTLITYLSLHIYASEISWSEIKEGKIASTKKAGLKLEGAKDLDLLLSEVKCRLAEEEDRRNSTTDKCKSLLTLSSLVLAASGIVVSKASIDATWTQLILLLAALSLLHVVVLISMHFAVGADTHPTIDQHDATLSGEDLRKSLINIYLQCQADRNARVNFLVELYKGARFYFLLGLTLIIVLLVSTFPARPKEDLPTTVSKQLTNNATFIERLSDRIASTENERKAPATIPPAIPDSAASQAQSDLTAKPTAESLGAVVPPISDSPTASVPSTAAKPPPPSETSPRSDGFRKSTVQPGSSPQGAPAPADEARKNPYQQEGKQQTTPPVINPPTSEALK